MRKQAYYLSVWTFLIAFFVALWSGKLVEQGQTQRLNEEVLLSAEFREQNLNEDS